MKLLCWNCRGIGPPLTENYLRRLVRRIRPSLLFLMETKHDEAFMDRKRASMNFANGFTVNPTGLVGTAGGLSLWWIANLDISILSASSNYIHVLVKCSSNFLCTFVHAPTDVNERRAFWTSISALNTNSEVAWLIVGDCNAVLYDYEKEGGNLINYSSTLDFRNFLFDNELMDMGYIGDAFTWTNGQANGDEIKVRLDRALCSPRWRVDYEDATVFHEQRIGSDHRPLSISLHGNNRQRCHPFRFDARWMSKDQCNLIIQEKWQAEENVAEKLKRCATDLKKWSKTDHDNTITLETNITARLEVINQGRRDRQTINEEKALTIQLNKLWKDENTA
ncbi:hypothetical protein LINGRAHAP2_LOCUS35190 [Linum grandiflorum]